MDSGVIKKMIEFSGESCPVFTYENPLLDKNVADLLAKSFVNLLDSCPNNKQIVLTNIRRSCKVEPTGHLCIDDDVTGLVTNSYEELLNELKNNNTTDSGKILDTFLMRNMKEINVSSLHSPNLTPEVNQALANLKETKEEMQDTLVRDIIYWNIDDKKNSSYLGILKSVWNIDFVSRTRTHTDDISIKLKPEIEKQLLKSSYEILETEIVELDQWVLDNEELLNLIKMCAISNECFQICCCIINCVFIKTDFDRQMKKFIAIFISLVQEKCIKVNCSLLYPIHLRHIVLLLDIRIDSLTGNTREFYVKATLEKLHKLHEECENDVIMLLSHFNQWFDLYFNDTVKF